MKKYTINDNLGNKKTIYADNLSHALTFVDSKIKDIDASSLMTLFSKYGKPYGYACKTKPKMSSSASKYLGQLASYTLSPIGKYDTNKARDFVDFLNKKGYEAAIFAPDIIVTVKQDRSSGLYHRGHERTNQYDSKVKDDIDAVRIVGIRYNKYVVMDKTATKVLSPKFDDVDDAYNWIKKNYPRAKVLDSKVKDVRVEKGDWFTLRQQSDVLYKVIDDQNKSYNGFTEAMIVEKYKIDFADLRKSHEIKIIKVGNESFHPERLSTEIIRFNSSKEAIDWFKRQKELRSRKYDSIKDEASLATTINALVNDEKAAADAYDVAIKNLEGSIDDTARQVLINIRDDERRHIENLYSILNGQVTEKNL